jgi:hypothetical protein
METKTTYRSYIDDGIRTLMVDSVLVAQVNPDGTIWVGKGLCLMTPEEVWGFYLRGATNRWSRVLADESISPSERRHIQVGFMHEAKGVHRFCFDDLPAYEMLENEYFPLND